MWSGSSPHQLPAGSKRSCSCHLPTAGERGYPVLPASANISTVGMPQSLQRFPFQVTSLIMPKLVKVAEYYAPIAILLGIVLYPLTYTSFLIAAHYLFDFSWWMLIIYFLLMPISGMMAFYFLKFLRQVSYKWKYLFLLRGKKNLLARLIADKTELGETFFG